MDLGIGGHRNLWYLRVRVAIDPKKPLFMGTYDRLSNGRLMWVQCGYERVFHLYKGYGRAGHVAKECD